MDRLLEVLYLDNWPKRRKVIYGSLLYIAVALGYIIWKGVDLALYQQIAITLIGAGVSIIFAYVFGAYMDDKDKRKNSAATATPSTNDETQK